MNSTQERKYIEQRILDIIRFDGIEKAIQLNAEQLYELIDEHYDVQTFNIVKTRVLKRYEDLMISLKNEIKKYTRGLLCLSDIIEHIYASTIGMNSTYLEILLGKVVACNKLSNLLISESEDEVYHKPCSQDWID